MAAFAASRFALFKSRFLSPHLSYPLSASHPKLWHGLCERIKQAAASSVCSKERQSRGRERGSMFPYAVSVFISTGRQTDRLIGRQTASAYCQSQKVVAAERRKQKINGGSALVGTPSCSPPVGSTLPRMECA